MMKNLASAFLLFISTNGLNLRGMQEICIAEINIDTCLIKAAAAGALAEVNILLHQQADCQASDDDGNTALHFAAQNGYAKVCHRLLVAGAHINAINRAEKAPLELAAQGGHEAVIKLLIARGAESKNLARPVGKQSLKALAAHIFTPPPLYVPCVTGNRVINSTTIDSIKLIYNSIHVAVESKDYVAVILLLNDGISVESIDQNGNTPLHSAALVNADSLCEALLENYNANISAQNNYGYTALHIAAMRGFKKVVEVLLFHGANKKIENSDGLTALDFASLRGHKEIVELFQA